MKLNSAQMLLLLTVALVLLSFQLVFSTNTNNTNVMFRFQQIELPVESHWEGIYYDSDSETSRVNTGNNLSSCPPTYLNGFLITCKVNGTPQPVYNTGGEK